MTNELSSLGILFKEELDKNVTREILKRVLQREEKDPGV